MTPKDFIRTWFANIDADRYQELERMMDSDHQFNNPMTPAPANKEQHLGMIKMMSSTFTGNKHHLDAIVGEGEWVTARGRVSCNHSGEFNGVPATNKRIEFSWIDVMHVVDGKVKEEYFEMNPMSIMQQING
jgi:predicted ester cyclase